MKVVLQTFHFQAFLVNNLWRRGENGKDDGLLPITWCTRLDRWNRSIATQLCQQSAIYHYIVTSALITSQDIDSIWSAFTVKTVFGNLVKGQLMLTKIKTSPVRKLVGPHVNQKIWSFALTRSGSSKFHSERAQQKVTPDQQLLSSLLYS